VPVLTRQEDGLKGDSGPVAEPSAMSNGAAGRIRMLSVLPPFYAAVGCSPHKHAGREQEANEEDDEETAGNDAASVRSFSISGSLSNCASVSAPRCTAALVGLDKHVSWAVEAAHEALAAGGAREDPLQQPPARRCESGGEVHAVLPRQDMAVVHRADLALSQRVLDDCPLLAVERNGAKSGAPQHEDTGAAEDGVAQARLCFCRDSNAIVRCEKGS